MQPDKDLIADFQLLLTVLMKLKHRNWKGQLSSLDEILRHYPYVITICTIRPSFADEALPVDTKRLIIPGFEEDTIDAIKRYFTYYRINLTEASLSLDLLSHPLTLRYFCEVTNLNRELQVGVEAMPGSLTSLFDRYLDQAAMRIAELAPRSRRYYEQDIHDAIFKNWVSFLGRKKYEALI